ncbi:hypothetical protein QFZ89_001159 [Paraburkholderia youngii]
MADTPPHAASAPYSVEADYAALEPRAREILDCWFGAPGTPEHGTERKLWFKRNDAVDAMLRERFGNLIDAANAGELDAWQATPLGALALVIVLDQFSRNCHRGTPRAFATDSKALQTAQRMVASGADRLLPGVHSIARSRICRSSTMNRSLASRSRCGSSNSLRRSRAVKATINTRCATRK